MKLYIERIWKTSDKLSGAKQIHIKLSSTGDPSGDLLEKLRQKHDDGELVEITEIK